MFSCSLMTLLNYYQFPIRPVVPVVSGWLYKCAPLLPEISLTRNKEEELQTKTTTNVFINPFWLLKESYFIHLPSLLLLVTTMSRQMQIDMTSQWRHKWVQERSDDTREVTMLLMRGWLWNNKLAIPGHFHIMSRRWGCYRAVVWSDWLSEKQSGSMGSQHEDNKKQQGKTYQYINLTQKLHCISL